MMLSGMSWLDGTDIVYVMLYYYIISMISSNVVTRQVLTDPGTENLSPRYKVRWDGLGVLLSGICLVHCLVLPIAVGLVPLLGIGILGHQQFHQVLIFLVLPTSAIGLSLGYRRHHRSYILAIGIVGVAILVAIALFAHELVDSRAEIIIASVGGIIVASSHILNLLEARKTACSEEGCNV
jgi:hypothetical protein